jgi:hypothetical protein
VLHVRESSYYRSPRKSDRPKRQDRLLSRPKKLSVSMRITTIIYHRSALLRWKAILAAVLDCHNVEIVGLSMADHMRKELCITAFENTCKECARYDFSYRQRQPICKRRPTGKYHKLQCDPAYERNRALLRQCKMESFFATLRNEMPIWISRNTIMARRNESPEAKKDGSSCKDF